MMIFYALLMICVLIFFHELGHFIAAKSVGVKVNEFAIGMGPKILKFQKGETLYSVRALPIGGFCAMEGEDEESDDERAFNNKKLWQKSIIIVAGAFMNLIIAIILMAVVNFSQGLPTVNVGEVKSGTPAYEAGILKGDKILSIDGKAVDSWDDFISKKAASKKDSAIIEVERGNKTKKIEAFYNEKDAQRILGISPSVEKTLIGSIANAPQKTWLMAKSMYQGLGSLITGKVSVNDLSGPVGIVYMVKKSLDTGGIMAVYLMALISLNLAIINMLPLPALDGGRLVMAVIRKFTGKVITDRVEGWIHAIGILLLLGLTVYVTYNDILKFILPIFRR